MRFVNIFKNNYSLLRNAFYLSILFSNFSLQAELVSRLDDGLRDYRLKGVLSALDIWTKNGPLRSDAQFQNKIESLKNLDQRLGECVSTEIIKSIPYTTFSRETVVGIQYARGSLYFRFIISRYRNEDFISLIDWSLDPQTLLKPD